MPVIHKNITTIYFPLHLKSRFTEKSALTFLLLSIKYGKYLSLENKLTSLRFSLLQYKRQSTASWSLLLVCIVLFVCFSQNLGLSKSCPLSSQPDNIEQIHTLNSDQAQNDDASQCSSSEQLVNAHTIHLDFAIPMFILALLIVAAILKQAGSTYFFTEPPTSYGVRRHLAFCTFQE
ncbi:hypothetical protein PVK63_10710 [Aliivibrio sp. S2TY2]|uniref:hypothetical protein n=1 Tax=Aliivibrio TaxID=511678 RepID=UPI001F5E1025|nr:MULTISPECIES: hypothetical protein [Aliivibrio]MDD9175343.1 hypothetical protein [Aliivibrio sp. S3TY1]MDD9192422.1 hypothetical protein [Aliivibrio sp. S2TY2]